MKYLLSVTIISAILLSGCKEDEESFSQVADKAVEETPAVDSTTVSEPTANMTDSLVAGTEIADEAVEEMVTEATRVVEEKVEESISKVKAVGREVASTEMPEMPSAPEVNAETMEESVEVEGEAAEELAAKSGSKSDDLMSSATAMASSMASNLNWTDMSWDKVAEIPYQDKDQLLIWALAKTEAWKSKLSDAAKSKGLDALSNLGDSGWQGALNTVIKSLDTVRDSSPETWEMARSTMVGAWETFEKEAKKYLGEG